MILFTFRSLTKPLETYENCFHKYMYKKRAKSVPEGEFY